MIIPFVISKKAIFGKKKYTISKQIVRTGS